MKITKEENGNLRISGLNIFSNLKIKNKEKDSKEKKQKKESPKYRLTKKDSKYKFIKEVKEEKEYTNRKSEKTTTASEPKKENKKAKKLTQEEIDAIYAEDIKVASNNSFMPSIRDGYVVYWELMDGNIVKRFGKYEDIKDKKDIAIRKSDIKEIELIEKGKILEEKIKVFEDSNTPCPEYNDDIERIKKENNDEVPTMSDGYITYYEIVGDRLIKRYGKFADVMSNDKYYIKYQDRNYYKELQKRRNAFNASEIEKESHADLEQYHKDVSTIYEQLNYYPTPREGYVTYYKDGIKRFGKYEDIAKDKEVVINDDDKKMAEDYLDLQHQLNILQAIANVEKEADRDEKVTKEESDEIHILDNDDLDLDNPILEETTREVNNDEPLDAEYEVIEDEDLDLEEEIVEETNRLLNERDSEEINDELSEAEDDNLDLEEEIVEETNRVLNERDNLNNNTSSVRSDYGRLEDLKISDEQKEYFEKLADEYIGYLENPTVFTFDKEYKVRSKY